MSTHPFPEHLPVERLLRDDRMAQGLARLSYLLQEGSLALITGHTGIGKSSLVRLFLSSLSRNKYLPVYLHLTLVSSSGLLKLLVAALGEVPRRGKERLFMQILDKTQKADLTTVVVIDEAHLLESSALTDLRLLVSSGVDEHTRLKIVLCGQQTLRDRLKQTELADLQNRLSVRWHLHAYSREQTISYLDTQMRAVGSNDKIFEPEAKSRIHDYSSGILREINNLATHCLIGAAALKQHKVNAQDVDQAHADSRLP
jgi:general secretion pathway protein A